MVSKRVGIYGFVGPYRFLSNFYMEPDGTCVEVEYQRAKCAEAQDRKRFDGLDGRDAKLLARRLKVQGKTRNDWENVSVDIMSFYVDKKFSDHPDLAKLLLATGDLYLEETNTWFDTFWGVCKGKGLNMLGTILMQTRDSISRDSISK